MNIPPSIYFKGDQFTAMSLKSQAIKFYHYIANQADLGGVGYVARNISINGSTISVSSYKEGNYGSRFGNIIIFGKYVPGVILPEYDIVIWPSSDTFPNGWGATPRKGLTYTPTSLSPLLIINDIPNEVVGGNCYWRDTEGKNLISWEGPWGFQIPPQHNVYHYNEDPPASSNSGYTAKYAGFNTTALVITRKDLPIDSVYDTVIVTHTRFSNLVYKNGSILTTTPYPVLGCGISADNLLVVVNISYDKDRVLSKKLNNLSMAWVTICDIDYVDASTVVYLERQGVYTFSQDGLNIITIAQRFTGFASSNYHDGPKEQYSTVVRVSLHSTFGGGVGHSSTTYTDDVRSSSTVPPSDKFIAAGFINNVEKLLTYKLANYAGSYSNNISFYLDTTELFTSGPGPFLQELNMYLDHTGSGVSTYFSVDYDLTLSFVDIAKEVFVLQVSKYTHTASSTDSRVGSASLDIETSVYSKNETTLLGSTSYNSPSSLYLYVGYALPNALPTSDPSFQALNTVKPYVIDHKSSIDIPHLALSYGYLFDHNEGLPVCKGVADKNGLFVGQIDTKYISDLSPLYSGGAADEYVNCTQTTHNTASLPYGGDASALFGITGTTKSISGAILPSTDPTRKIFLIN